jgi:quercetin dioxygenase-like cupin family protein
VALVTPHAPRRVVTGHDEQGTSIVLSDAPTPKSLDIGTAVFHELWNTKATPAPSPLTPRAGWSGEPCARKACAVSVGPDGHPKRVGADPMADLAGKRFESPDEVREFTDGKGRVELVDLNGHAVGRGTFEPGWRWSEHVKPIAGTDSCQVEHIGYVLEGRMALRMDDGTEREFGPGETFHMPPGHDAWIVGDQACVLLDFGGLKGYAQAS